MQRKIFFIGLIAAILCSGVAHSQDKITIRSSSYTIDSTYDGAIDKQAEALINRYKPTVNERVSEKVGTSAQAMTATMPESLLTNLACNIIWEKGSEILKEPADLSLLNFGGFRASLPEGEVLLGDIYEIFPFDNTLQIAFIKGKYLRQLFTMFAAGQMHPMSHVVLTIQNKELKEVLIGGVPLDDEKIYKLVTIDYLIFGGDKMEVLTKSERYVYTSLLLRDVITEYFINKKRQGVSVDATLDGRVKIIE
ncbi:MAG: 5'-nucleotidase C-terminal domain-containing protein [Bacteroidales bacterium]|nr:5'-nucleotidase C-terminal domain-containing protein [Bacteroidales bacterium]